MKQTEECPHCGKLAGTIRFVQSTTVTRNTYHWDGSIKKRQETERKDTPRKMVYCAFCLRALQHLSREESKAEAEQKVVPIQNQEKEPSLNLG